MQFFWMLFLMLVAFSCSSDKSSTTPSEGIHARKVASIEIKGMVCEMGCGSEIRKSLKASGAVSSCDFDFKEGRDINTASVLFDDSKISVSQLKTIIEGLNNHQYSVVNSSVSEAKNNPTPAETSEGTSEGSTISMNEKSWKFPNLFDLLSSIVM